MNAGDTFLPTRPYNHLYMVISDPDVDPENVVLVCFVTNEPEEEQLCIVQPGEHPFVTRETTVRFKDGRNSTVAILNAAVHSGALKPHDRLSDDLLRRVRAGASLSPLLPKKCKRVLEDQSLI